MHVIIDRIIGHPLVAYSSVKQILPLDIPGFCQNPGMLMQTRHAYQTLAVVHTLVFCSTGSHTMRFPLSRRPSVLVAGVVLVISAVVGLALFPQWTQAAAPDPVTAAWQRARAAGNYRFTSDVTQVTLPLATVTNVGRTSRTEELYMEGQNDLRAQQMAFTLWAEGGNTLQAESGISIRTEGGTTYARHGAGEWEVIDSMTDAIAPQGDFLGYLAAIKAVEVLGHEARSGIAFTRYSFAIDSARFAMYMQAQLAAALRARGELPPGVQIEAPAYFGAMVGAGELWVGDDGLPLRQVLTLQFPPQGDEQVQAQVVVNFSDFGQATLGTRAPAANDSQGLAPLLAALGSGPVTSAALLLPLLAAAGLLLYYRRARALQVGVVVLGPVQHVVGKPELLLILGPQLEFDKGRRAGREILDRQLERRGCVVNGRTVRVGRQVFVVGHAVVVVVGVEEVGQTIASVSSGVARRLPTASTPHSTMSPWPSPLLSVASGFVYQV